MTKHLKWTALNRRHSTSQKKNCSPARADHFAITAKSDVPYFNIDCSSSSWLLFSRLYQIKFLQVQMSPHNYLSSAWFDFGNEICANKEVWRCSGIRKTIKSKYFQPREHQTSPRGMLSTQNSGRLFSRILGVFGNIFESTFRKLAA